MSDCVDNNNENELKEQNELALKWDKAIKALMNKPPHFIYMGDSVQEGKLYVCSRCNKVYDEKAFIDKQTIQCNCGAELEVPKCGAKMENNT